MAALFRRPSRCCTESKRKKTFRSLAREVHALSRKRKPSTLLGKVLGSGDVLLSHGLSPYYHRGCSVSLPCSEWERVVPLRDDHQKQSPNVFRGSLLVK